MSTTSLAKLNSRETCVNTSLTKTTNAGAYRNTYRITWHYCNIKSLYPQGLSSTNLWNSPSESNPTGIYLLKVNNRNTRTRCEICSKLTIKTPARRNLRRSVVSIVNFEHMPYLALVLLLLTLNMCYPKTFNPLVNNVWK